MSKYNRKGDTVAASQMLKALNTLQMFTCNQNDLSFGQCSQKSATQTQKAMNFQIYMEKQVNKTTNKQINRTQRSVSPLGDITHRFSKNLSFSKNQRKTLTPRNDMKNKSIIKISLPKKNRNKQYDKENKGRNIDKSLNLEESKSIKVSNKSKKILDEREKKGNTYIPIQMRAEGLLKQRQQKLAKLQKQKQFQKMLQQKECTFKPNISRTSIKCQSQVKKYIKPSLRQVQQKNNQSFLQQSSNLNDNLPEQDTFQIKDTPLNPCVQTVKQEEIKIQQPCFKKYKNQKFNNLLDFLL